jgi:hypothetical protein
VPIACLQSTLVVCHQCGQVVHGYLEGRIVASW